jgi:hypothetical protein
VCRPCACIRRVGFDVKEDRFFDAAGVYWGFRFCCWCLFENENRGRCLHSGRPGLSKIRMWVGRRDGALGDSTFELIKVSTTAGPLDIFSRAVQHRYPIRAVDTMVQEPTGQRSVFPPFNNN